jgi:glycosyltransferase involved in cell wall biosynthesis
MNHQIYPISGSTHTSERVLVYDFNPTGHCPGWLYLVAGGFREAGAEVRVCCRTDDARFDGWVGKMSAAGCEVGDIPGSVRNHAEHAAKAAAEQGISRIFFPNFDSLVYEMGKLRAAGMFEGMDIGGIWLRPDICGENPGWWRRLRLKWLRTRANKLARRKLRAVANNRQGMRAFLPGDGRGGRIRLFFTSPDAAAELASHLGEDAVMTICDPWLERAAIERDVARTALGLDRDRVVLLHAGTSRPEKGLKDLCEALLGMAPQGLEKLSLLRAGTVGPLDAPALQDLLRTGAAMVLDRYVAEDELALCYAAADWVLLPYRDQKESSGVLIHAAANRRPVIASDYGWIARQVRQHDLGRLFKHHDVNSLRALLEELAAMPREAGWDDSGMVEFSALNSPETFRKTLNQRWLHGRPDDRAASR